MSGIAYVLYRIFISVFFVYKWKKYFRIGLIVFIVVLILIYVINRSWEKKRLEKLGLDPESYIYYSKYTSFRNRVSFIFTYSVQDYVYEVKTTNKSYNFSKGLFRYEDNLGEYYTDRRIVWYAYTKKNLLKNRLSLHKLRIYSLEKCNRMLLEKFPEQQEAYESVKKAWAERVNELPEKKKPRKGMLKKIDGTKELHKMIRNNLYAMEVSRKYIMDNKPRYVTMLKKTEKRKDDVREIKNFQVDLNDKKDR
jgi:hypothetical protein